MATSSPSAADSGRPRFRWLTAVHALLWLLVLAFCVTAFAVLLAVVVTGLDVGRWPVQISVTGDVADRAADLPAEVGLVGPTQIMIHDATFPQTGVWACGQLATLGLAAAALVPLLRATGAQAIAGPFSAANVRRLRRTGLVLLFGGVGVAVVRTMSNWLVARLALGDVAGAPYVEIPWWQLFAAVAVLAVTELVRHGTAMREELDAVI